jgi:hypothetical protein
LHQNNKQTNKNKNKMKNSEITMRDILQLAIVKLKIEGNTEALYNIAIRLINETDSFTFNMAILRLKKQGNIEALYNIAIRLTNETDSFTFNFDLNKDILDVLEVILKEKGFMPLEMNCTKFSSINIITIRLNASVK